MIAIIIPYYKLSFFKETLDSLANQTDKRFTVYIGNDASPEEPTDLLNSYEGKFNFVYHRFETNLGGWSLIKQWDRCIALADCEEWLMILGDDDYLSRNLIAQFYDKYDNFNYDSNVVRFATQMIFETTKIKSIIYSNPILENASDSYIRKTKGLSRSSLSEYFFTKEVYLRNGFKDYPLAWHSDDKAWLDFSEEKKIYSINEAIVVVRVSVSSISGRTDNLDIKYDAKVAFLEDLILQNSAIFDRNQLLEILLNFESLIKQKRKLTFKEWYKLFQLYFLNFKLLPFVKLNRRFLKATLSIRCF